MNERVCVIAGTFDPVTVGHLDLVERALKLFDKIYLVAFENSAKKNMFSLDERREMLRLACLDYNKIIVDATSELLADYAVSKGAGFLVKGVRGVSDYDYEHNLYLVNREIGAGLETVLLPAKSEHLYISSAFVRELIKYKKDIGKYVPNEVAEFVQSVV